MKPLELGVSITPTADGFAEHRAVARRADELGLDLIGIQDHPYQWRFLDTWMLMAMLLAETERVRVFPDVANLPLRGPAMLAKQAASLDVLSGGRFELGLGAGAFWEAIAAMGGPAHEIGIWIGAYKPKLLALTGRLADGWVPSLPYLPPDEVPAAQARIDEAAADAGRAPDEIRRVYNVPGLIADDVTELVEAFTRSS